MKAQLTQTNCPVKIKAGDVISFTNKVGYKVNIFVKRVEEKSWYAAGRNSYGTLVDYSKYNDFQINFAS